MKTPPSILRSTLNVASTTVLSRLLGFTRDVLMAFLFGASVGLDVFLVAFKIPNLMRALFAEGAFAQGLVPQLTEIQLQHSPLRVQEFIARFTGSLLLILLALTVLCEVLMPLVVVIFAPGYLHDTMRYHLAIEMLRITFPYFLLITLTAFYSAVLNTYHSFTLPSVIPVVLNVVMIFAALFLSSWFQLPEMSLAWGVLIAGAFQLACLTPSLYQKKLLVFPRVAFQDKDVKRVLSLLLPSILGGSVVQVGLFINMMFASFLAKGSISWLYYADRLTFFPLGVVGVTLSTVTLPHLARHFARQEEWQFTATVDWAIKCILLISIPAMVGLFLLARPIVEMLFHHGLFSDQDVVQTANAVMAFALGIPGFMAVKVFSSALYARKQVKLPVYSAVFSMGVNILLTLFFMNRLQHVGLALATSISTSLNALLLYILLYRSNSCTQGSGWKKILFQILCGNAVIAWFLWYASVHLIPTCQPNAHLTMQVLLCIAATTLLYFGVLRTTGVRLVEFTKEINTTTAK